MLTVEEQQNSIRYSIELDHCYTSRTSPSDPAPIDPLPVPNSPDADKVNIFDSSIQLQMKQQQIQLNQDQKIIQNTKMSSRKSVGRPRRATASNILPSNIIKTSPSLSSRPNTINNNESKHQQQQQQSSTSNLRLSVDDNIDNNNVNINDNGRTHENDNVDDNDNRDHINSINNVQLLISESSESGPSDNDSDFGPRGGGLRAQRRVRARGGRKGLTTRGGTMVGRRGRPNKHQMDIDQVKRLNNEMAAAVDAMKTPGRIDNHSDFSIKATKKIGGIKTMGGNSGNKRKDDDEDDDYNKSINSSSSSSYSSSTHEKTQFQTTNQVKANLINANMLKGDMILTKPGQSRNNNQKLLFLQKKSITKPSELKTISSISSGPSKKLTSPISVAKSNVFESKTIEDPNNSSIKNSDELINNKSIDNTDKTEIPISKISKTTTSSSSLSSSPTPTVNKINKSPIVVNKKDRKKSESELLSIKVDEQQQKEKGRIIDNNKLTDNKKHSVKKEQRKAPVVSAVVLGPALFSTPDIIRRVGSIGEGKSSSDLSDNHGTTSNNTSLTDEQINNSTTPMDLDETMKIITSIKTELQNINNTITNTNTNDNNLSSSSTVDYTSTTNIINNDHHQNKMQLMDIDDVDDELPKNNDDDDLQSALDPGESTFRRGQILTLYY